MAVYTINWIDDSGTVRSNNLTVEDNLVRFQLHNKTKVRNSKYDLGRRHKYVQKKELNTAFGNVQGDFEALYLDNGSPQNEITELKDSYVLKLPNLIRQDQGTSPWTPLEISASAANVMVQYLLDCKPIFDLTSNRPDIPIVFTHPTLFTYTSAFDSGANDGTITVTPRGGTGPFEAKLGASSESWVSIVGNSHTFTGLTAGGGNNPNGSWQLRIRDSRSPKVISKVVDVFVSTAP